MEDKRERNLEIVRLWLQGKTLEEIGQMFGLSKQRVHIIVRQAGGVAVRKVDGGFGCKLARS